ncbi:MAG TPA: DNA cytosine methyltransferase [Opitutaceae bacterium]
MSIRLNSYFSGCGLVEIGLERAGVPVQQSFEIDAACCATQRRNFKHEVIEGDVTRKTVAADKGANAMMFTFPCNRYSSVADLHGTRTGDDLFLHAFRHAALAQPDVFVVENVPGMRKFPVVMEAMTKLPGYHVSTFCPVRSELWLPQRRDRLIIFASRRPFAWRPPTSSRRRSLASILEKDPQIEIPSYVTSRLGGKYRDQPIISDPARGDIAPTCVAHYAKDQSTRLVVDRRFPHGVRPYTVREYARLQGVPDSFVFVGTDNQAYKMTGNGVSVPVGEWIGRELKRYFAN